MAVVQRRARAFLAHFPQATCALREARASLNYLRNLLQARVETPGVLMDLRNMQ